MCLQYKPTVVACFCIHVACKWSNWEIPLSNEDKQWFSYVDPTVTTELLQQLTEEFLVIFESCPSRLKEKIMAIADNTMSHNPSVPVNSPFDTDPRKIPIQDPKYNHSHRSHDIKLGEIDPHKHRSSRPHESSSSSSSQQQKEREYRERKERERLAMQHGVKPVLPGSQSSSKPVMPQSHHRAPIDPKLKPHPRPTTAPPYPSTRVEPRDILREAARESPFGIASNSKDIKDREHKDSSGIRCENKDLQKRDYLLKPNVTESNNLNSYSDSRMSYSSSDRMRIDPNRQVRPGDPNKLPYKHDSVRRHEDSKAYLKSETDNIKKHLSSVHEKSSAYLSKSSHSTSQKIKSPFNIDASKSVPKSMNSQPVVKPHPQNGSNMYNVPVMSNVKVEQPLQEELVVKEPHLKVLNVKEEPVAGKKEPPEETSHFKEERLVQKEDPYLRESVAIKEEKIDVYQHPKRPSLFSPEKSPPSKMSNTFMKEEIKTHKKIPDAAVPVPSVLSPMESPNVDRRTRAYSSSSEPELRPVMKKIDQVEGFENIMRDTTIGIDKLQRNSDIVDSREAKSTLSDQYCSENRSQATLSGGSDSGISSLGLVNGIETNPTLISNLLKEAQPILVPCVGANTSVVTAEAPQISEPQSVVKEKEKEHHHHKSKKKNKEKHKHKDKDRSKEEKEKKKKHKDKDREKHRHKEKHEAPPEPVIAEPIKIKIQKDKIQPVQPIQPETLKIRIPKDKIKTEGIGMPSYPAIPTGGLKLKIPKEVINNCTVTSESIPSSSKKRERDRSSPGETPPSKMPRTSHKDSKQNGRHSFNKVSSYPQNNMRHPHRFSARNLNNNRLPMPRHVFDVSTRLPLASGPTPGLLPPPVRQLPRNPMFLFPPPQTQRISGPIPPPAGHRVGIVGMPDMSVPPPNFMYVERQIYPRYYNSYAFPNTSVFQQGLPLMPCDAANPPLPTDAPPETPPPPPPPE